MAEYKNSSSFSSICGFLFVCAFRFNLTMQPHNNRTKRLNAVQLTKDLSFLRVESMFLLFFSSRFEQIRLLLFRRSTLTTILVWPSIWNEILCDFCELISYSSYLQVKLTHKHSSCNWLALLRGSYLNFFPMPWPSRSLHLSVLVCCRRLAQIKLATQATVVEWLCNLSHKEEALIQSIFLVARKLRLNWNEITSTSGHQ